MRFQNMDLAQKSKADNWHNFISGKGKKKKTGFFTGTFSLLRRAKGCRPTSHSDSQVRRSARVVCFLETAWLGGSGSAHLYNKGLLRSNAPTLHRKHRTLEPELVLAHFQSMSSSEWWTLCLLLCFQFQWNYRKDWKSTWLLKCQMLSSPLIFLVHGRDRFPALVASFCIFCLPVKIALTLGRSQVTHKKHSYTLTSSPLCLETHCAG
jgi:hypothetical protein